MPDRVTVFAVAILLLTSAVGAVYVEFRPAPYSEGVFWKVSKDGKVVGHILGTIHSNDERVTRIPESVMQVFTESKGYAIEAFPGSNLWNPYHGYQSIARRMMLEDNQTLEDVAGKEIADQVYTVLKRNRADEKFARRIKPWAAIHSLSIKSEHTGPIIDQKLLDLAVVQDKELYQIESPEELLAAFYGMPMDSQVSLLRDKLRAYPDARDTMEKIIKAYEREDVQELMDLSTQFIDSSPENQRHYDAYVKHAIDVRSVVMAHYMRATFWNPQSFVAVGALHLYGENGVLSLLEQDLFGAHEVERVRIH